MIVRRMFNTPAWGWRSPFGELERMKNQVDRLFEGYHKGQSGRQQSAGVFPLINVSEDKDAYRVRTELPGMKADDLDISATADSLAISGERKIAPEDEEVKYHRRERESGKFSRMIKLSGQIDPSKVEAGIADGILTVVLPKSESAKPRQIKIG